MLTSTIGRAGKQLFASIETPVTSPISPAPPGQPPLTPSSNSSNGFEPPPSIATPKPRPAPPLSQPPPHLINDNNNRSFTHNATRTTNRVRRDSIDSTDLEFALTECAIQENAPLALSSTWRESPTKPQALSPRGDREIPFNTQSIGQFDELTSSGTAMSRLLESRQASMQRQGNPQEEESHSSAADFLQSLQKTLESKRSFNKDELLAQLENLKQQNLILSLHLERQSAEAQQQMIAEREARQQTIASLQSANDSLLEQLLEAKSTAEKQLQQEKQNFAIRMDVMEAEKTRLQRQMDDKAQQMAFESQIQRQLREEMNKRIQLLETDAVRMRDEERMAKLEEANSQHAQAQHSTAQQAKLLQIQESIAQMDMEKSQLIRQLEEQQRQAQEQSIELQERLLHDRKQFEAQVKEMDVEKRALCDRLLAAENRAQLQHQVVNEEIEKQQHLQQQQQQQQSDKNGDKSIKKTVSFAMQLGFGVSLADEECNTPTTQRQEAQTQSQQAAAAQTPAEESKSTGDTELQEKLRQSAQKSKERVAELTAKLKRKNKARLRKSVARMKDLLVTSEKQQSLSSDSNNKGDGPHSHEAHGHADKNEGSGSSHSLMGSLPSMRSLFDLAQAQNASRRPSISNTTILTANKTFEGGYQILGRESALPFLLPGLAETAEDYCSTKPDNNTNTASSSTTKKKKKTVMDLDEDDSDNEPTRGPRGNQSNQDSARNGDSHSRQSSQTKLATESQSQVPDLPPAHLAAANGDVARLTLLHNLDSGLVLDVVDSVNRYALFYSVSHSCLAATEYILSLLSADHRQFSNTHNHLHDRLCNTTAQTNGASDTESAALSAGELPYLDLTSEVKALQSQDNAMIDINPFARSIASRAAKEIDSTIFHSIYSSAFYRAIAHMDAHGDAVLHAAALAGSERVLQTLLSTLASFLQRHIQWMFVDCVQRYYWQTHPNASIDDGNIDWTQVLSYPNTERVYTTVCQFLVNNQNALGLTPSHLANSSEILELLHQYHANLLSVDFQLRSVLFIACAMNKESCVEYLINSLDNLPEVLMSRSLLGDTGDRDDGEDEELGDAEDSAEKVILEQLMKRDYRGDTPLHAAACNDSVNSLLLLLQSGIDPRLHNDKQLTAHDLALLNRHEKSARILAEYTLHYCTSSEFDSVLFLKTLEGQHKIEALVKDMPQYMTSATKAKAHSMSMFSLKNAKSMKLQRYGHWIAYYDAENPFAVFWYNHETSDGQWETPLEVMEWQERYGASTSSLDIFEKTMQAKMSMRLRRVGNWVLYSAEEGKTFYYNELNGDFQWTSPFVNEVADQSSAMSNSAKHTSKGKKDKTTSRKHIECENETYVSGNGDNDGHSGQPEVEELPDYVLQSSWRPYLDSNTGLVYWYNHDTQQSQWESPFDRNGGDRMTATMSATKDLAATTNQNDVVATGGGENNNNNIASLNSAKRESSKQQHKNVFDADDEDEDEDDHRNKTKKASQQDPVDEDDSTSRRNDLKAQLKQFHRRNTEKRLKMRSTEEFDEPVVRIHDENDLDL